MTTSGSRPTADPTGKSRDALPEVDAVAARFAGDVVDVRELGRGNINRTYLVATTGAPFVLQRLNQGVFADPLAVVRNFALVTACLAEKADHAGGRFRVPTLRKTEAGHDCWTDAGGGVWRAQTYIDGRAVSRLARPDQAAAIGRCLGWFHRRTADMRSEGLEVALPGFHVLPGYLAEYDRVAAGRAVCGTALERQCMAEVEIMRPQAALFQEACADGRISARIVHGDPKIENFLFDGNGEVVSLIDLDTVGPGLLHHDIGDCLRSCCNRGGEGGDAAAVRFDLHTCRAWFAGYSAEMGGLLSRHDRELACPAIILITFELGLRFFTDHLRGDTYFRVRRRGENLERARNQFALMHSIVEQQKIIRQVFLKDD
ncbi:aminoglycoside phosphotransferase family protein [Desulfoprunum benzoelyticum]|uniref:Ser/Thr protein kinase RdoA (MazF antagonist) n=1 Tax=Desulfoprunum benzoelyticum TaxID=1506996 RepID=A0A840UWN0_9BACT|nr:aminoglycoside phosphotransferase family protein [Desulfoprunum benzoelyticum]MBB5347834.1 Ser/Thr protein kinase RdoA (MazF antagonist) [Desulfoprunum benzoelyticum]MBM9530695.1 aminoglycoside phosphotransferase family protein [Desulfoprunum benzoelyticum]